MKYSVIIPTMYFHVSKLQQMVALYDSIDLIGEILIVNNCKERAVVFTSDKVREIGNGINLFVNPSWKLGVAEAKYENVILSNDDIVVHGDLRQLLDTVGLFNLENKIIGPSKYCYTKYDAKVSSIKLSRVKTRSKREINYGFGVFMIMKKDLFINTPIPNDFLIWYGDHILFLKNEAWEFSGLVIETEMRGTTSKLNLNGFALKERLAFNKFV